MVFKKIIYLILFSSIIYSASAQKIIAVASLTGKGMATDELEALTNVMRIKMTRGKRIYVIKENAMHDMLKESAFNRIGKCNDLPCAKEMGVILYANYVVFGTINKVGTTYNFNVWTLDMETMEICAKMSKNHTGKVDKLLLKIIPKTSDKLIEKIFKIEKQKKAKKKAAANAKKAPVKTAAADVKKDKPVEKKPEIKKEPEAKKDVSKEVKQEETTVAHEKEKPEEKIASTAPDEEKTEPEKDISKKEDKKEAEFKKDTSKKIEKDKTAVAPVKEKSKTDKKKAKKKKEVTKKKGKKEAVLKKEKASKEKNKKRKVIIITTVVTGTCLVIGIPVFIYYKYFRVKPKFDLIVEW